MKLLILGASGFIGNACLDYFTHQNEVIGIDRIDMYSKSIILDTDFSKTKQIIENSLADVIINCAGSSNIQESFIYTEHDFNLNVLLVQQVLSSIKNKSPKTKFINLSSAAVYGNALTLPIKEDATLNPLSPYGFHKILSEQLVTQYAQLFGTKSLSIRIFSAYGNGLKRQFIYDLVTKFNTNNKSITLFGSGKESRDFVYITDIINAIEIIINNAPFNGEIYNLASGKESFINETSKIFAGICNYKGDIMFSNNKIDGYPINWKADITKLRKLGYTPKIELSDGLTKYYEWIKDDIS